MAVLGVFLDSNVCGIKFLRRSFMDRALTCPTYTLLISQNKKSQLFGSSKINTYWALLANWSNSAALRGCYYLLLTTTGNVGLYLIIN